jgi:hypothetical protein
VLNAEIGAHTAVIAATAVTLLNRTLCAAEQPWLLLLLLCLLLFAANPTKEMRSQWQQEAKEK